MSEPASAPTASQSGIWGVLRTGPPSPRAPEKLARTLVEFLDGLVAVGSEFPAASTITVELGHDATSNECLAAGLRELPSSAAVVVWFDSHDPGSDPAVAIAELSEQLEGCDAALFAAPVTEAIKDVAHGCITSNVPREGLCVPVPPMVIRGDVARSKLLELLDGGHDPVAALIAGGLSARLTPMRAPASL